MLVYASMINVFVSSYCRTTFCNGNAIVLDSVVVGLNTIMAITPTIASTTRVANVASAHVLPDIFFPGVCLGLVLPGTAPPDTSVIVGWSGNSYTGLSNTGFFSMAVRRSSAAMRNNDV